MKNRRQLCLAVICICLVVLAAGCKSGKGKVIDPDVDLLGGPELTTTTEGLPDIDSERLEKMLFDTATGLMPVYFEFDSFALNPIALATLKEDADKIRQAPGVIIQIEGHCDERGTQEYNLALGEKRALTARAYLIRLGISGDRLITISYGEEDPVDSAYNENAWRKNRRCEFNKAL